MVNWGKSGEGGSQYLEKLQDIIYKLLFSFVPKFSRLVLFVFFIVFTCPQVVQWVVKFKEPCWPHVTFRLLSSGLVQLWPLGPQQSIGGRLTSLINYWGGVNHPLREEQTGAQSVHTPGIHELNIGECVVLRGTASNHLLSREAHTAPNIGCLAHFGGCCCARRWWCTIWASKGNEPPADVGVTRDSLTGICSSNIGWPNKVRWGIKLCH